MIDRQFLESKPNWVATFERLKAGTTVCLMQSRPGGYYWHEADYSGLFAWGATASFHLGSFWHALNTGYLRLVAGQIPDDLRKEV